MSNAVLTKLGMTADQVLAERRAGNSLAQIAQAKGVGKDALIATILDEHKAVLDGQVTAGRLTQAQADAMQTRMATGVARMVDEVGPGAGAGFGPGRGPRMTGQGADPGMMGHGFGPGGFGPWEAPGR
jgi:hypothetical protein